MYYVLIFKWANWVSDIGVLVYVWKPPLGKKENFKALMYSVCPFPWCKHSAMACFKLLTNHWMQSWEETGADTWSSWVCTSWLQPGTRFRGGKGLTQSQRWLSPGHTFFGNQLGNVYPYWPWGQQHYCLMGWSIPALIFWRLTCDTNFEFVGKTYLVCLHNTLALPFPQKSHTFLKLFPAPLHLLAIFVITGSQFH